MNILIVDDERLARSVSIAYLKDSKLNVTIFEAINTKEAELILKNNDINLIILDIEMPEENGIDFLIRLQPDASVIFSTAYNEHAIQAFELNAIDYLLKPYDKNRFITAIEKAIKYDKTILSLMYESLKDLTNANQYKDRIVVKDRDSINFIKTEDIISIAAKGDYCEITTKKKDYLHLMSLNHLEKILNPKLFVRIHRSSIININELLEINVLSTQKMMALMSNNSRFDISRTGQQRIKNLT